MNQLEQSFNNLLAGLPNLLVAILLLILAFIVASVVRNLIKKVVGKTKFASGENDDTVNLLGNLGFLLTLLLFLPGALDRLGLNSVTAPIVGMMNNILAYIPNIIGAAVILAVGLFLAKIVKQIADTFFKKVGVDEFPNRIASKTGARVQPSANRTKISEMLSKLLYVLILIPVVIAALNALNIAVISGPAVAMLNDIFAMIPRIIAGLVVLAIGIFIAKLAADLVFTLVDGSGLSRKVAEMVEEPGAAKIDLAKIISEVVRYAIILIFLVQALNLLQLGALTAMGTALVAYIPKLISAAIIMIGAYLLGSLIKKFIVENFPDAAVLGNGVRFAVLIFAGMMALSTLGIATNFIWPLFLLLAGGLALALALAFGLGGRDWAGKKLEEMDEKVKKNAPDMEKVKAKIAEKDQKRKEDLEKLASQPQTKARNYKNNMDYNAEKSARNFDDNKGVKVEDAETFVSEQKNN